MARAAAQIELHFLIAGRHVHLRGAPLAVVGGGWKALLLSSAVCCWLLASAGVFAAVVSVAGGSVRLSMISVLHMMLTTMYRVMSGSAANEWGMRG